MRYVLALLAAVNTWGIMSASLKECEPGVSLAKSLSRSTSSQIQIRRSGIGQSSATAARSHRPRPPQRVGNATRRPLRRNGP